MSGDTPANVILIEDHKVYRESIREVLEDTGDYKCLGNYSSLEEVLQKQSLDSQVSPDFILLDLGLPGMSGLEGIRHLRIAFPTCRILVLTAYNDRENVFEALKAGASGYLLKTGSASRLIEMLEEMDQGGTPLDPQIAGMILATFQKLSPAPSEESLSEKETQALGLFADGETKKGVAAEMDVSYATVDQYVRRIFKKLHVQSMPAAVKKGIQKGILDLS